MVFAVACFAGDSYAAVAQRTTAARPSVSSRTNVAARASTSTTTTTQSTTTTATTEDTNSEPAEPEPVIENKTSQFDSVLSTSSTAATTDTSDAARAEMIRQQRAALDAADAVSTANQSMQTALARGQNACDIGLRQCMQEKCGTDFSQCRGDTDTAWGNKMDLCRMNIECTGEEYRLFSAEIKADRDMNARLASYNSIINCGNLYNDCIITQCGTTFSKCLGKSAGDSAIAACKTIAGDCLEQDSGLASRAMQVFAILRQDAEVQVQRDEQRLYELRDEMRETCATLGAMFDERTMDCVYTVEFYAGEDGTLYASKKSYAGSSFDCTPDWFGIDITTFMENAYRLTSAQTSASAALLGSGLGVGVGAITSGAIERAVDRSKADKALKNAQEEYEENYGTQVSGSNSDSNALKKSQDKDGDGLIDIKSKTTKQMNKENAKLNEEISKNLAESNALVDATMESDIKDIESEISDTLSQTTSDIIDKIWEEDQMENGIHSVENPLENITPVIQRRNVSTR